MKPQSDPARIVIVGEALVDVFGDTTMAGGAPFNVARHLGAFGLRPLMITRIGNDANGALLLREFVRFGLSTAGVQVDPLRASGRVQVTMHGGDHRFDIVPDQAFDHIDPAAALSSAVAGKAACLYHGSLIQRAAPSRAALVQVRQALGAPVFLDLNLRTDAMPDFSPGIVIGRPAIIKVNADELRFLLEWQGAEGLKRIDDKALQTHRQDLAGLMASIGASTMVVTLGADGALALDSGGHCVAREAGVRPAALVDTVGAGDAFASVILTGHLLGWPLARSMERATAFSAAICALPGAVPADLDFYAPWRDQWQIGDS